ncbi:acetylglutamate kinase [Algisphaera agarilytica]|uniref:Acetylglutamate kinase n=1 Tax=Algisphaera agarilytica TaxID=1385975 RepID=A0A7X0H8I5_9BACT|nr:acetylglutamate kinase [Algisphaera agarilytica]MBB6431228.1 acetylglutamate kinase [Algisphaera agarilytica]
MQHAIDKAAALVEAHAYIRQFAGAVVVVKIGGSIMDEPDTLASLVQDVCFMASVGMRPIMVHGGGKAINAAMGQAGLEAQFVQGRRYTDDRTLAIAEHVLVNQINKGIVETVGTYGAKGLGLHSLSSCVVFGKVLKLDGEEGRKIDIGLVGEVERVNAEVLSAVLDAGIIPVIAPIARDAAGGKLNINADSVAGHVAAAINAEKLVLVSDTHGIRRSEDVNDLASHLTRAEIDELIQSGIISAGMLPKVEASLTAVGAGVRKAHIIDGRIPHSLLLEVYTESGIGTEIVL